MLSLCAGSVFVRVYWPREHDGGRAVHQHQLGCQLPGVPSQEELAERPRSLHQEYNGTLLQNLLNVYI